MGNEEIRVMTLVRKAKLDKEDDLADTTVERYFTTDYFNMLISEKQTLDVPLNLWINGKLGRDDNETAVQRYSLYFSSQVYAQYEKNRSKLHRGDPFDKSVGFKFLSVIQVYISPEILRRMTDKKDAVWSEKGSNILLGIFMDDLYDTVERFRKAYPEQNFIYRVYFALSAGDFAVVIKSQTPELSFGISSYIRSRLSETGEKRWAVYKTYTLLAFEKDIKGWEKSARRLFADGGQGRFVLRASYSWNYWKEKPGIRNLNGINRLNGRYDISMDLNEQEFDYFYGKRHKKKTVDGQGEEIDSQKMVKVDHLLEMIDNDYLSYINERYLIEGMEITIKDADIKSLVKLEDNVGEKLDIINQEKIQRLNTKLNHLKGKCENVCKEHKILQHYFDLLKRQIDFCRVLNEQSDTRIYAKGMETLLNTILESLDKYNEEYNKENECYISENEFNQRGQLIIQYTKKAIYSINTYMEYVRNNNLQSLQTPNYNIESDMGMEKILIGYGEYLREFLSFYLNLNREEMGLSKEEFLPVIVPDMNSIDITVEALFPSSKAIELGGGEKTKTDKTLIVINSPSMMELEDVPMAMAMLSHEIAHQFRYEKRKDRNQVLLELFAAECAEMVTDKLIDTFQTEQNELVTFPDIKILLQKQLAFTIRQILTNKKYGHAINMEAPLDYLKEDLGENLLDFFSAFTYTSKMESFLELFIQQTNELTDASPNDIKAIKSLYDVLNNRSRRTDEIVQALEKYVSELEIPDNYSFQKCMLYMEDLDSQLKGERLCQGRNENADKCMYSLYRKLTRKWKKRNDKYKDKIQKSISVSDYRMWALAGRYFGLDVCLDRGNQVFNSNETKFLDRLKQIKLGEKDIKEAQDKIGMYREITSDIFMCCVMDLNPFSYLHVVVTNMWRNDLIDNPIMIERIISVIFVISVEDDARRVRAVKKFNGACLQLLRDLEGEIDRALPEVVLEFKNIVSAVSDSFNDTNGKNIYTNYLEKFRRDLVKKHNYKNDLCIKIDKLLLICDTLIREGDSYIDQLYERSYLRKDYFKAYKVLNTFREKMSDDPEMAQLKGLNADISKYLGRLYETGKVRSDVVNRQGIEFLLRMYYNYKFRNAGDQEVL